MSIKVAVLYICTGKYSVFWENFYQSSEKFFLRGIEKKYFVFTDDAGIINKPNICKIYEKSKGFPMDSLLRFQMFLSIKEELDYFDYVFFLNSNMLFIEEVHTEILPLNVSSGLMATIHPGAYHGKYRLFNYERRKKSKAFIPYESGQKYFYYMGGFNGGRTKDFLKLSSVCNNNIKEDLSKGIIAIYHDESHLNKYLHGLDILRLSPSYGYPEDSSLPVKPKIIILNKIKHAGKYFDKLPRNAYLKRLYFKTKRIIQSIIWRYF